MSASVKAIAWFSMIARPNAALSNATAGLDEATRLMPRLEEAQEPPAARDREAQVAVQLPGRSPRQELHDLIEEITGTLAVERTHLVVGLDAAVLADNSASADKGDLHDTSVRRRHVANPRANAMSEASLSRHSCQ
jgi:hypothetical protein